MPHLVAQDFKDNENVKAVFLVDEDADRARNVVFTRGLWGEAHSYSDDVKEKEVEWVLNFSHRLKAEAEQHGYPWIEVEKKDTDLDVALQALNLE